MFSMEFELSDMFVVSPVIRSGYEVASPQMPGPLLPTGQKYKVQKAYASYMPVCEGGNSFLYYRVGFLTLLIVVSTVSSSFRETSFPPIVRPVQKVPLVVMLL